MLHDKERQILKDCSKDGAAYQQLLALFDRKTQEQQHLSHELQRKGVLVNALVNSPIDSFFLLNPDATIVAINNTAAERLGQTAENMIGKDIFQFFPPEVVVSRKDSFSYVVTTRETITTQDQRGPYWFDSVLYPICDANDDLLYVAVHGRDITDRKATEEALKRSENTFRQMFENTPAPGLLMDPKTTHIVDANVAACEFYGYDYATLCSMRVSDLNPAPSEQVAAEIWAASMDGLDLRGIQNRLASGEIRELDVYASSVEIDGKKYVYSIVFDMTERLRMERALQESEALKDAVLNAFPDLVLHLDRDGTYLDIHTGAPELLVAPKKEMLGKRTIDFEPPENVQRGLECIKQALETQQIQVMRYQLDVITGKRWFESRQIPFRENEVLSIVRDITAEHELEIKLKASEERFRNLFEQSNDAVFIMELDGKPLRANQRAADMLGYTVDEIPHLPNWHNVPPDEVSDGKDRIRRVLSGETFPVYERTFIRADRSRFIGEINLSVIRDDDGNPLNIQSVVRDVSERKAMEAQLRDREARYRSIISAAAEGILLQDERGTIIMCNESAQRILSVNENELLGHRVDDSRWHVLDTDGQPVMWENMVTANTLKTGKSHSNVVRKVRRADDTMIWISINTRALVNEDTQQPYAVVTSFTDITALKRAQQRELDIAVERERVRLITDFVEDISHEFRTPLSIISTSAYFLSRLHQSPEYTRRTEMIERQVNRITRLVDKFTLMAKLDGGYPLKIEPVPMLDIIRRAQSVFRTAYTNKDITMSTHLTDTVVQVCADAEYLPAAFDCIIENAIRYTAVGGQIDVTVESDSAFVTVSIQDNGIGIAPENLDSVFKRFWRNDEAHSEPGFGLGLAITQKIIELHNGMITVNSTPGQGTEVRVTLPTRLKDCTPN